jgi:protein-disulfide isomerase
MASSARFRPLAAEARKAARLRAREARRRWVWVLVVAVLALAGVLADVVVTTGGKTTSREQVSSKVSSLLAGIPEQGETLGRASAPVTLVFYGDLECLTTRAWALAYLPAIIQRYVRPGKMKIEFHAFKTDTHNQPEFVAQQTAAIAAGAQDRLWPFIETFYYEQGREYTPYVTENFLEGIAKQVPGLDLARWHRDRNGGRRSEVVSEEDQSARALGFHDTPAFQLGPTGGSLKDFTGRQIVEFVHEPHPVSLVNTQDIATALRHLGAENTLGNSLGAAGHG